ncbi:MAG: ABC transporter substrate-binding protein [Oligoflexia bacterium]|nr:ABC transporter substrate-binding protein [Oligoflexia bacterium]
MMKTAAILFAALAWAGSTWNSFGAEPVKIGFNYPRTGPYAAQGLDQLQASQMAVEEINAAGGILGRPVELVIADSQSNASVSIDNATRMIEKDGVKMIFGGSASTVAIAVGKVASDRRIPFFGTLTYSTETTGVDGRKYVFRECYDSYAGARALGEYLRKFNGRKFHYVTARYTWGYTTEKSIRKISKTENVLEHRRVYTPFPKASKKDFADAIAAAKAANPDVLVLVLFGEDMVQALKEVRKQGMNGKLQIIVPNLTLGMAEGVGPEGMEGIVGAIPWTAQVPWLTDSAVGKKFVEKFSQRHQRLPDTSGASAYTILYEYKAAAERARSFEGPAIVAALEGHEYTLLKDKQYWRKWDHQSIQTVYAVRGRKAADVKKSRFKQEYFEILGSLKGEDAFIPREEWNAIRKAAGKSTELE